MRLRPRRALVPALLLASTVSALALASGGLVPVVAPHDGEAPPPPPSGPVARMSNVPCGSGHAGPFACHHVDLLALAPRTDLGAAAGERFNDLWGWTDPQTHREYALVGREGGTSFVDLSDPMRPVYLGVLPTRSVASPWRSIKTYREFALVVADRAGGHGLQVFDLTALRGVRRPPVTFAATAEYFGPAAGPGSGLGSAHNVAVDEESGFAYVVGSTTCAGGLHIVDVRDPRHPTFAGCFADDGYTHDVQCVVYRGPDARFAGRQMCFAANEDTLTIVDVTDKARPVQVSRTGYPGAAYTHQAWLTEDHRHLLLDDELDEMRAGHGSRTYIWSVADLARPQLIGTYTAPSTATDHNLYIRGGFAYQANYTSGLRILDLARIGDGRLREAAFFDVDPSGDAPGFAGSWSPFPFFASGVVLVNSIGDGLFVLRPELDAHDHEPEPERPEDLDVGKGRPRPPRPGRFE
jgi:choice-of-anchor B domain-containing protein